MAVSVLVIDAEEDFANQLADALRGEGIEPVVTGDGKVGLDLAKINVPAAIVLCVELPRMSGYSICAKLKKDPALKGVPLIITSADATPETFEHHKKLKTRAEEYLKKPFPAEQLVGVLKQYVNLEDQDAEAVDFVAPEDLSIEDQPPAILSDDEAFSEEEASTMERGDKSDMQAIDEMLSDLSRPVAINDQNVATPIGEEDEMLTSVGYAPVPKTKTNGGTRVRDRDLENEVESLRSQLQEAQAEVMRERQLAEKLAANASSIPSASGGREVVALKKELNVKERELLDLKEKVTSKEKEILGLRDREAELEGQLVQVEEERNAALAGQTTAESRMGAAERARTIAEEKSSAADARAKEAESRAKDAENRAKDAEKKVNLAENRQTTAEVKAKDFESKAKDAESKAKDFEAKAKDFEAKVKDAEGRLRRAEEEHEASLADLNKSLGEANAREAELDGAVQSATAESKRLKDSLTETEKALAASRSATAQQNNEITRLTTALATATGEGESLRQQLAATQERANSVEAELSVVKAELESLRAANTELEQEREVSEGRITRAYQKIRDDEKIKGKAKKAIEIALALLQESGYSPDADASPIKTETGDIDEVRS